MGTYQVIDMQTATVVKTRTARFNTIDYVDIKTFNYLSESAAKAIVSICKLHRASATRKPQISGTPPCMLVQQVTVQIALQTQSESNEKMGVIIQAVKDIDTATGNTCGSFPPSCEVIAALATK